MTTTVYDAQTEEEAIKLCKELTGFTPDAVREVDSGQEGVRCWMCFEFATDAELWDKQL
jgi:hypothetical protein